MDLKRIYKKYKRFFQPILYCKNRFFEMKVRVRGNDNKVSGVDGCRMKKVEINICGDHNKIYFGDMTSLFGVNISIQGSNNSVFIGERNYLNGCVFCIEDNNNMIKTGDHVYIYGNTEISAIESTHIVIGENSLFSANNMIRTGDSHAIVDKETNKRVNPSKDIVFGNRVWLGNGCKVLKGATIGNNCIIGTGSIITHKTPKVEDCILTGVPAKIVSEGVTWTHIR